MSSPNDSLDDPLPGFLFSAHDQQVTESSKSDSRYVFHDEKYRLIRTLGEGGMGEVILAEQSHPISREVAIKVIRSGKDSVETLSRFEAERQSLAVMSHPNIATVFDAGLLSNGLPFFAMEFVDGVPLDEYCDLHRLTIPERIGLFMKICEGVSHAHQKGIIHRDLKPGNILVLETDKGAVPKIIDFGLAKATDHEKIGDQSMLTQMGQVLGTIRYLSPEQAGLNSSDVDTRADIYSLGVILYELLIGSTPLDAGTIHNAGLLETLQKIRNEDATPLTAKFRVNSDTGDKVARDRQITNQRLKSMIQGDLECIVMKSLDVDRNRRYGSATELANDLRRFLANEPVLARPASTLYRLRKFVERNRVVSAMLVGMIAIIVSAVTVSIWLALWALDEADVAKRARVESDNSKKEALKEADKARKAESESSKSRERALAALGKIREFAFEETMKTRYSKTDALINVILDEYQYWSKNQQNAKLLLEKANALLQLADLRIEQGNIKSGLHQLEIVESELENLELNLYPWAKIASLQCELYRQAIDLREIKEPANKNLAESERNQISNQLKVLETRIVNILNSVELLAKETMDEQTLLATCGLLEKIGWQLYLIEFTHSENRLKSWKSKKAFRAALQTQLLANEGCRRFPNNIEFLYQKAFAMNRMALYLYKHRASKMETERYGGTKIGPLYDQSIDLIRNVIQTGYRPYASQQKLLGFYSNRGMYLLNKYRNGISVSANQVMDNYDQDVQQLLTEFPNNYSFMNTVGVFLLNKADALQSLGLLDDEQNTREEAISLLNKTVEVLGYNSSAGRRLDLVQIRLIKNQVLQNRIQRATELALELHDRNPNYSDGDAQSTAIQYALLLAHGRLPEEERAKIRQRLSSYLLRITLNKYWITPPERWLFSTHELLTPHVVREGFHPFWASIFYE